MQLETITPTDYSSMKSMVLMRQVRREREEQVWLEKYALFHLFSTNERHSNVISNSYNNAKYPDLSKWIRHQRNELRFRTQEQIDALDNAGMIWDLDKLYWERDLKVFDRYFEKFADRDPLSNSHDFRKFEVDGSLDDGFESDGQKVNVGSRIIKLRRRIAYQCWEDTDYNSRRRLVNGTKRNKHIKTTTDLTPSQIKDLIRVNFTMRERYSDTCVPLHEYLERRPVGMKIDYQHALPNNYK